jgi:hypothetical protein
MSFITVTAISRAAPSAIIERMLDRRPARWDDALRNDSTVVGGKSPDTFVVEAASDGAIRTSTATRKR